ncbi:TonB-dependent receptor [Microbulbifer sp.]|uniref:TonB-dependent receptor n=1 Tax=Microbulbifer sp. TaxID=1908541 RepID=UPI003F2D1D97
MFKKKKLSQVIIALAASVSAQQVLAQEAEKSEESESAYDAELLEEIVIQGVRINLENAQDIKRNADTFVDSISAADMGSLPDRSVLEAMQRMPGVAIERFAASEDPDHFGVEGSGAIIRGMTATRSEFNGRDSFTANSGRGLSWQDVPPELMGGVDIYKNQSADMIEGGIGGTVSLRTRKPFDTAGQTFAVSGDVSYGDMTEESTPTISALYSDRWMTDVGEFGVLLNAAHSELRGTSHGIQSDAFLEYDAEGFAGAEGFNTVWVPNGSNMTMKNDDRTRKGYAAAFQWANTEETILATAQFMRSDARLSWTENAVKYQGDSYDGVRQVGELEGTRFSFGGDGIFEKGILVTEPGWRGSYAPGDGQFGSKFQADTRHKDTHTIVDDAAINLRLTPDENWEYNFDLQYIAAETAEDDLQLALGQWAAQVYDTTGDSPTLILQNPYRPYDTSENPNWFQDPDNYWWRSAMDHYERSEGESVAARSDVTYHFTEEPFGLLRSVKSGVRWAEREQTVRNTGFSNWGTIGAEWKGDIVPLSDPRVADQGYEFVDFSDFHRGDVLSVPGDGFLFPTEQLVKDVLAGRKELFNNAPDNDPWVPYYAREDLVSKGLFQAPEVYDTTEINRAAYVRLDFGSDETTLRFNGNIGLRYVELEREALGSVQYPDFVGLPYPEGAPVDLSDQDAIDQWVTQPGVVGPDGRFETESDAVAYARDPNNWLTPTEKAFANDAFTLEETGSKYSTVLPSFNLKLGITDDLLARFAVSKAIALPDMSEVKNQAVLGARQLAVTVVPEDPNAPPPDDDDEEDGNNFRQIESVAPVYWQGSGGNPSLWPMESVQYDVSLEWYFASVGSLTASLFYKDLSDTFIKAGVPRNFANPVTGQVQTVDFETTVNAGDGYMQGFELAYQQFYDMLPAPWDGLGVQLNYTYIDSGLKNSRLSGLGDPVTGDNLEPEADRYPLPDISLLPLKGVSKNTFNIVGMYEKNGWSARLAYNWRDRYLLTTRDVISKYPLMNEAAGFLDGSVFYDVNDSVKVGMQFTNILDTQTETTMILDDFGTEAARSWFVSDRRAALIVRATF